MATTKFTITLDDEQFAAMKHIVATGGAPSVSAFVKKAVDTALTDVQGWNETLEEMLAATGGPITAAEQAWVDEVLGPRRPATRRKARRS